MYPGYLLCILGYTAKNS